MFAAPLIDQISSHWDLNNLLPQSQSPERVLWQVVLLDAIINAKHGDRDDYRWLFDPHHLSHISFAEVCSYINIDPTTFRKRLKRKFRTFSFKHRSPFITAYSL